MPKRKERMGQFETARTVVALGGPSLDKTEVFAPGDLDLAAPDDSDADEDDAREAPYRAPKALKLERDGAEALLVPIYPDRTYLFGRAPESSFVFPSDAVSRLHAQLRFSGDRWMYRDLNSLNGTFLFCGQPPEGDPRRGARVIGAGREHAVRPGETLLLANGQSRLVFLEELPEGLASAVRAGVKCSSATQRLERSIEVCARHRLPVFLLGPSGCGKTFVARAIHERGRMQGHFVILNCGRLPHDPAQLASELLGHVRGAFTGALSERKGKLWRADQGTLFLDEVESLPRSAQDFLIDVLEGTGSYAPYGASAEFREPPPRFRLMSASKVSLARSGLRPDLCQRLAAGDMVVLPTVDDRRPDIPDLIEAFIAQLRAEQRIDAELTPEAVRFLQEANWPGEIRELQSTVKVVVSREHANQQIDGTRPQKIIIGVEPVRLYLEQRQVGFGSQHSTSQPLPEMMVQLGSRKRPSDLTHDEIQAALTTHGGNKTRTAAALGIALNTLKARLRGFESRTSIEGR